MRSRLVVLAVVAAGLLGSRPSAAEWPSWLESLLFNTEERTRRGIEAAADGEPEVAVESLETAARLDPDNPVTQYNAGTARLGLPPESRGDVEPLLRSAAESGRSDLVPRASYNLGNARLDAQQFDQAIEAYKAALRADPDYEDAKFNLELAQRLLEEQQQQSQSSDDQQQGDQQQDQQQEGEEKKEQEQQDQEQGEDEQQSQDQEQKDQEQEQKNQEQEQKDQEQKRQQQQDQEQQQDPSQQQQPQPGQEQQDQGPLPQFKDLPEMTQEEAAAILEAVENLEREQRREEAKQRAKANAVGRKDW